MHWRIVTRGGLLGCASVLFLLGCAADEPAITASAPQFTATEPRPQAVPQGPTHPDMHPHAIEAAARSFDRCVAGLWPLAAKRGVSRATFERATRGLAPDLSIMELLDRQPEFTKPVWEYLDILVNDARIATGREMLQRHAATFDAVERAYGVDRYVVTAIWGIESNYGPLGGERSVLRSTATLACIGRRQNYFRDEFLATLEILHRGDVRAEDLKGSWAGAFGPTQFMPTSFKRFAVDFDNDGKRDVVNSIPDMIASTANNLKKDGWQMGATWGYEVVLPERFDFMLADRSVRKPLREWEALGVRRAGRGGFPRPGDVGSLMLPAGANGPAFVVIDNFRAIMKYNPSESYALAIGHLADRLRGGDAFVQAWPRDQLPLTRAERFELQERLAALGLYRGGADGSFGPATRAAVRDFQARAGLVPDGFPSNTLLERIRRAR
jgi:lytic murein transglycosylase